MPHRTAEFRELCVRCGERSSAECLRCGHPLCRTHAPPQGRRCRDCETDYLSARFAEDTRADKRTEIWAGGVFGWLIVPTVWALATKKRREQKRAARARAAFLAERPRSEHERG